MITYEEFLEKNNVITESEFDDIVRTLPKVNIIDVDFNGIYDLDSQDDIAASFIVAILENWDWATCEDVDFDKRTFKLEDVACIKDLEEIKETFSEWWTISNYDEMLEICKNNEKEEALKDEKEKLICFIRNNASIEQLKEFKESIK